MPTRTKEALDDLMARRFGTAELLIDAEGNVIHVETVFNAELRVGESLADWIARAKVEGIYQPGDRLHVPVKDGKTQYVRIIRPAK
jgi:hypothetical protein